MCDIRKENAEFTAREVERLFGRKPLVLTDLDQVLAREDILAVDVVTDGSTHHQVAAPALAAGKHALVEKPLGITIRACQHLIGAARQGNALLATAENYRRDPPNRLVKAILDARLLGDPFLLMQTSVGGGDSMAITPWRHLKEKGAIGLDMGVHYADIIQYYLGEYDQMFGSGFIVEPVRRKPDHENHPLESYRRTRKDLSRFGRGDRRGFRRRPLSDGVGRRRTIDTGRGTRGARMGAICSRTTGISLRTGRT